MNIDHLSKKKFVILVDIRQKLISFGIGYAVIMKSFIHEEAIERTDH